MALRKAKTPKANVFDDFGGQVEAPRLDLPKNHSFKQLISKAIMWGVMAGFVACALSLVLVLGQPKEQAQQTSNGPAFSLSRTVATTEMVKWLTATPSPLPGGHVVTIDDVTHQPWAEPPSTAANPVGYSVDIVHFTLADKAGNLYRSSVEMHVDKRGGSVSMFGSPSLVPITQQAGDQWAGESPWPGYDAATPSDAVAKAVSSWASAYVGGDPDALRQMVGDGSADHWYQPISGVSAVATTVTSSSNKTGDPSTAYVQVQLALTWAGQPAPAAGQQATTPVTMDLLVLRADTAAPQVVAWGDPGSAPALSAYQNATSAQGRQASAAPSAPVKGTTAPTAPAKKK